MTEKSVVPTKLIWEEPEDPRRMPRKGSVWTPVADALRNNPGEWACIGRNIPTDIVSKINKGIVKCWQPAGAFVAVTRNHTARWVADVYVRYVGEHGEYAE